MSLACLEFEGRATTYFYLLTNFGSQLGSWLSVCADIKVATSQVLEKAKDNEGKKLTVRKVHPHEKASLAIPLKSLNLSSLLLAFLELC